MIYHKCQAITKKILDCKNNTKQLFSVVNSITYNSPSNPLPENKSGEEIADYFADFFIKKIQKIRDQFNNIQEFKPKINAMQPLKCFSPLTMEAVQTEIMSVKNKSCELDIIPTESCIETIAQIVNISLRKGLFATDWKTAIVHPLL